MKTYSAITIIILVLSIPIQGQTIKKLNDPSIVAHYKRNTFEAWGDWRPYPKYLFGVQTNFAYATVWGWLAPARNREYKDGPDIRPLKPTGEEVQRVALAELQRKEAEKRSLQVDSLQQRSLADFAHWTSLTVDADPLWLLYYKKMLKPLNEFPPNPQNYQQWGLPDEKTYQSMLVHGGIQKLREQLDILKDKYHQARSMPMPRGKRFLLYHDLLIEWRSFTQRLAAYSDKNNLFFEYRTMLSNLKNKKENFTSPPGKLTDKEIVRLIMDQYKNQF